MDFITPQQRLEAAQRHLADAERQRAEVTLRTANPRDDVDPRLAAALDEVAHAEETVHDARDAANRWP